MLRYFSRENTSLFCLCRLIILKKSFSRLTFWRNKKKRSVSEIVVETTTLIRRSPDKIFRHLSSASVDRDFSKVGRHLGVGASKSSSYLEGLMFLNDMTNWEIKNCILYIFKEKKLMKYWIFRQNKVGVLIFKIQGI
jgi:hypothetical protein